MLIFNVCGQKLERSDNETIARNARFYPEVFFTFSGDWTEGIKTAIFTNSKDSYHVIVNNRKCTVPSEVLDEDSFKLSLYNENSGRRITTNQVTLLVSYSGYTEGSTPEDPTPTIYEQILSRMENNENEIVVERARINNLISLSGESTTADAELKDIRVGADGTTYLSAGDAVRSQVNKLSDQKVSKPAGGTPGQALLLDDNGAVVWGNIVKDDNVVKKVISLKEGEYVKLPEGIEEQTLKVTWAKKTDGISFYNMVTGTVPKTYDSNGYKNIGVDIIGSQIYSDTILNGYSHFIVGIHIAIEGSATIGVNASYWLNSNKQAVSNITETGWYYFNRPYGTVPTNTCPMFQIKELSGTITVDFAYGTTFKWLIEQFPDSLAFNETFSGDFTGTFINNYAELPIVPTGEYFTYVSGEEYASASVDDIVYTQDNTTITVRGNSVITAIAGGISFTVTVPKDSEVEKEIALPWENYKWAVIGDSYTDPTINATVKYHQVIKNLTGINTRVLGTGGTGWWKGYDTESSYRFKAAQVDADTDVVTFLGSINDWKYYQNGLTIGDFNDTLENGDNTLCAYINDVFDAIEQTAPKAQIIVFSPMYYHGLVNRLQELYDALKSCTENRGYEFVDMLHIGWLRIQNNAEYAQEYCTDYSDTAETFGHPNNKAHAKFIAPKFYAKLKEYLPIS